jgi:hypothetical protein
MVLSILSKYILNIVLNLKMSLSIKMVTYVSVISASPSKIRHKKINFILLEVKNIWHHKFYSKVK